MMRYDQRTVQEADEITEAAVKASTAGLNMATAVLEEHLGEGAGASKYAAGAMLAVAIMTNAAHDIIRSKIEFTDESWEEAVTDAQLFADRLIPRGTFETRGTIRPPSD